MPESCLKCAFCSGAEKQYVCSFRKKVFSKQLLVKASTSLECLKHKLSSYLLHMACKILHVVCKILHVSSSMHAICKQLYLTKDKISATQDDIYYEQKLRLLCQARMILTKDLQASKGINILVSGTGHAVYQYNNSRVQISSRGTLLAH